MTGVSDNETAVIKFKQKLNSSEMYYNTQPFPKNESDEEAKKKNVGIMKGQRNIVQNAGKPYSCGLLIQERYS